MPKKLCKNFSIRVADTQEYGYLAPHHERQRPVEKGNPDNQMATKNKSQTCLIKGCQKEIHSRGLCVRCYAAASRAVRLKKTSWDKLVHLGLALERDYSTRPTRVGKFMTALRGKK